MLQQLYIKNFTLIDELEIDFGRGFSVITGETGAGKSIILGAIGLLLGNRADAKQIKRGESKCVIEAHFDLSNYHFTDFFQQNDIDYDPEDCILRREVNANGKSRGFINDIPVSLSLMKELGEHLIDIHSQHQNLLLQKEDFMLGVIDILAANQVQRASYRQAYEKRSELRNRLDALKRQIEKARENEDFIRYQCQELEKANLHEGEQEQLEQESETLEHAEEIKSALFGANNLLTEEEGNVVERLKNTINSLHGIEKVYPCVTELAERLESAYIEVKDIAGELGSKADRIDFNPEALDIINAKLDLIYSLQQKHHVSTVDELIALYAKLKQQLEGLDHSEENLAELENAYEAANQTCLEKAATLTRTREKAAKTVGKQLKERLIPLGIPNVRFEINMEPKPLCEDGADRVQFLFSANKNSELQPIAQIASGGEIARVMLSLKALISGAVKLPTIIFDEIDTGVSGRVAEKMAQMMKEMGQSDRQVISITHLPQIAAQGTTHHKVVKEDVKDTTISRMRKLTDEERIGEIAQMLSGSDITPAAIENAKSLLGI